MKAVSVLVIASALVLHPALAPAEPSEERPPEALFREGRVLMDRGQVPAACAKFEESQRLEPAAGTLLNLADCYEKDGRTASAWRAFKDAAASAASRNRPDWVATATRRVQEIEPRLSTITVVVSESSVSRVERDGTNVGPDDWGKPVPVDPGPHVVTAIAPERRPFSTRVLIGKRAQLIVNVPVLEPVVAARKLEDRQAPPDRSVTRILGFTLATVGVLGLGIGAYAGTQALSRREDARTSCEDYPRGCSLAAVDPNDDARSFSTVSTVSLIAGGALVLSGLVLVLTSTDRSVRPRVAASASSRGQGAFGLRF